MKPPSDCSYALSVWKLRWSCDNQCYLCCAVIPEGLINKVLYREAEVKRLLPLIFYTPFLTEKVLLLCTVHWKMVPLKIN